MEMSHTEHDNMIKPRLVVIAGPTGVGKTKASVRLAKKLGGEVVSADSMQIYKGMDIGTAKVTKEEMDGVPHHLIDILEPWENYDVTRFKAMAGEAVKGILERGHLPIVCGGTGFYIQALLYDIDFGAEEGPDIRLRKELTELAERKGRDRVHELLKEIDPVSYEKIPANNLKRVIRAIEYHKLHGEPISAHNEREREKRESPYDFRFFALTDDRVKLYERIDRRVDRMMEQGLLSEVKGLMELGIPEGCTSMQAIGYRELIRYLKGELSLSEAVEEIKKNSRHYAKRQLTWLRRERDVTEINISETGDVIDGFEKYLWQHGDIPGGI